ncbi:SIS domain-containing protein [Lacrimispora saccharolytica]|uniref:Sugar isomerase (SIS) n=1 Tax=Lacrimispora saccharolytica (strain ATCC 35040 / DSM 2544 / NRCC 2533 / WM1) TaxID=610130 RepID=D9R9M5_LACSW|nr:SIS domain-containing protein [Lacrimispora saccharolytica]ADL04075.1 sugar isomerase (SIS) [[Clostridium] saccharolyticum WM1]QRV21630.1 SIS domain-containing protein [Lacrimispora saccharolytica]
MKKSMIDYIKLSSYRLTDNFEQREDIVEQLCREYINSGKCGIKIVASGSSYNSAAAARYYMQNKLGEVVHVITPHGYVHFDDLPLKNMFEIVISQSGCSTNCIEALKYMGEKGKYRIVLTGNMESNIKNYGDLIIDYGVGIETVDFVTMGVVTLMEFLMLFALEAGYRKGKLTMEEKRESLDNFYHAIAKHCRAVEAVSAFFDKYRLNLSDTGPTLICGNGPNKGAALEGALKFQETLKIPVAVYETEEFLHGPDMQLAPNYTVYFIDDPVPDDRIYHIFQAAGKVTGKAYFITSREDVPDERCIKLPLVKEEGLTPLLSTVVFQYLSAELMQALDTCHSHPYFREFEKLVSCKTENYVKILQDLEERDRS